MPAKIECEIVEVLRTIDFSAFVLHHEVLFKQMKEFLIRMPVKIAHKAIIINHFQMRSRETDCKEEIILLITRMVWIGIGHLFSHQCGSGTSVMPIGYIHVWNFSEYARHGVNRLVVVNHPERMSETILTDEIIFRLCGSDAA